MKHGKRGSYQRGCRCPECREANARYRRLQRKMPEKIRLVDAGPAREHILWLSSQGIGEQAVADATDLDRSTVSRIRGGRLPRIRATTNVKILAVDTGARLDGSLVPKEPIKRLVRKLRNQGYTLRFLARSLGYKSPMLQFLYQPGKLMRARNALDLERLFFKIQRGKIPR